MLGYGNRQNSAQQINGIMFFFPKTRIEIIFLIVYGRAQLTSGSVMISREQCAERLKTFYFYFSNCIESMAC